MDGLQLYWGDTHCQYPPHIAPEAKVKKFIGLLPDGWNTGR